MKPGTIIKGRYRIEEVLSDAGGMGELLRATDVEHSHGPLALKYCRENSEEHLQRFRREARLMLEFAGSSDLFQISLLISACHAWEQLAMADVFSKRKRSSVMAAIRSKGNKDTELRLAAIFRAAEIKGWRRHASLPGRPDFVFPRYRLAVFVDGCFWHGCPKHGRNPSSNRHYWLPKLQRNRERDNQVKRTLTKQGWIVLRLWEHDLTHPSRAVARVSLALNRALTRLQSASR